MPLGVVISMNPDSKDSKLAQHILNLRNPSHPVRVDGDFGRLSMIAAQQWIGWHYAKSPTPQRWLAAVIQHEANLCDIAGVKEDAYWGPTTDDASDRLQTKYFGTIFLPRPDESDDISDQGSTIHCWNPSTSQFRGKYGSEGEHQTLVQTPYPLRLDWDLTTVVNRFSCHESVSADIRAAMVDVLNHYGIDKLKVLGLDRFGGCLNVRLKRGGSTPSVHSWGVAVDWYPSMNQLRQTRATALFGKEAYEDFLNIWEKHGFMSLGRCYNFDYMHLQRNP